MDKSEMFKGFNKEEWREALSEQNKYIKDKYGYDLIENKDIDVKEMNENANEAQKFINCLSEALRNGWKASDERVKKLLKQHIEFLNEHITNMDGKSFFNQARFFLEDDFHRNMLENHQVGLSYYLYIAAEVYAGVNKSNL